jgi:hypothetical protein
MFALDLVDYAEQSVGIASSPVSSNEGETMNEEPLRDAPFEPPEQVDMIVTDDAPEPEGPGRPLVLSVTVGLVVALLMGALWAGVVVLTKREIGIFAWLIGLAVGAAMALAAGRKSTTLGGAAVVISLLGLVLGKFLAVQYGLVPMVADEIVADEGFMAGFGYSSLVERGEVDPAVQAWWESTDEGDEPPAELADQVAQLERDIQATVASTSEAEKRAWAEPIARNFVEEMPLADRYNLGGYDLIWVLLAVVTAWGATAPRKAGTA